MKYYWNRTTFLKFSYCICEHILPLSCWGSPNSLMRLIPILTDNRFRMVIYQWKDLKVAIARCHFTSRKKILRGAISMSQQREELITATFLYSEKVCFSRSINSKYLFIMQFYGIAIKSTLSLNKEKAPIIEERRKGKELWSSLVDPKAIAKSLFPLTWHCGG